MRKPKYEFGNVGSNTHNVDLGKAPKRCNDCNYCNGIDGSPRAMFKDRNDITGGYVCEKCHKASYGAGQTSHEDKTINPHDDHTWHDDDLSKGLNNVDGEPDYDEMVEDLISQLEKAQDR